MVAVDMGWRLGTGLTRRLPGTLAGHDHPHRRPRPAPAAPLDGPARRPARAAAAPAAPPPVLSAAECRDLAARFDDDAAFRSTIDMGRHRFGAGSYRYFAAPLPSVVDAVR